MTAKPVRFANFVDAQYARATFRNNGSFLDFNHIQCSAAGSGDPFDLGYALKTLCGAVSVI